MSSTRARAARWVGLLLLVWVAAHASVITWDGLHDEAAPADLAVVLGNQVLPDGAPSERLRARLDRAVALYRAGQVRRVMASGGRGVEGHEEAEVMGRYLAASGIPQEHIIIDRDGIDTWHTARNAKRYMDAAGMRSAVAVSQFYHVSRCKLALRRARVAQVSGAHARYFEIRDLYSLGRELPAYDWYLVRPAQR